MKGPSLKAVEDLISEVCGFKPSKMHGATLLEEDLGITGDDGAELIEAFAERFGVDMSEFGKSGRFYFHSEGIDPGGCLINLILFPLGLRLRYLRDDVIPITAGDLARAAESGVWRDPELV
jgi:hypothetical protein